MEVRLLWTRCAACGFCCFCFGDDYSSIELGDGIVTVVGGGKPSLLAVDLGGGSTVHRVVLLSWVGSDSVWPIWCTQ